VNNTCLPTKTDDDDSLVVGEGLYTLSFSPVSFCGLDSGASDQAFLLACFLFASVHHDDFAIFSFSLYLPVSFQLTPSSSETYIWCNSQMRDYLLLLSPCALFLHQQAVIMSAHAHSIHSHPVPKGVYLPECLTWFSKFTVLAGLVRIAATRQHKVNLRETEPLNHCKPKGGWRVGVGVVVKSRRCVCWSCVGPRVLSGWRPQDSPRA